MGRKGRKRRPQDTNDVTEMWRSHRHEMQERRSDRRSRRTMDILALADRGFTVRELTPYHFRINEALDLYPTCNRYHNLKTQRRGGYQTVAMIVAAELGV